MALQRRAKVQFEEKGVDAKYHFEAYDTPSVDDIISFMAQSEAQRRGIFRRDGESRVPQTPSDELKAFLMDTTG